MLKNIKAVIFDMDGTLIDSMWLWKAIDIEYLKKFGHDLPEDLQASIEGKSFTESAYYFKERFKIPDSVKVIMAEWNKMAWAYYEKKVTMKEQAEAFLEHLKAHEIMTGIGTSNSKEMVGLILEKFELGDYFNAVRTSCEVGAGKPSPDIYLKVAEDLNVAPEHCLVFEDVPMGIMAAKNAGMKCCAIYDEFSKSLTTEKKKLADYYIESFDELMNAIRNED